MKSSLIQAITQANSQLRKSIMALGVLAIAFTGYILLTASKAATPTAKFEAENATLASGAVVGSDNTASNGQFTQFNASPTPPPPVLPPPASSTYPAPGSVGFRGNMASLTIIDSSATAPVGTTWDSNLKYLRVNSANLTLDGVYVKGGIDFYGSGTLTIRNSIIEFGYGSWVTVVGRAIGSTIDVRDSTLRWRPGGTPEVGSGVGSIQPINGNTKIIAVRNDISGTADGLQTAADYSYFEQNWIHDLSMVGTYPNNTHNDGIQIYGGKGLVFAYNRIEIGFMSPYTNAAIFFQVSAGSTPAPQIIGNYLSGGGYILRFEGPTDVVVKDNILKRVPGDFGYYYVRSGGSIAEWTNNKTPEGTIVNQ